MAAFEFGRRDWSKSILFAAMAVECQFSDTYKKWAGDRYEDTYRNYDETTIEEELRRWGTVRSRIQKVSEFLHPPGVERFIEEHPMLKQIIDEGYPTTLTVGDVIDGVLENLFKPRNRIVHHGVDSYDKEEAKKAVNLARLGLEIVRMLEESYKTED